MLQFHPLSTPDSVFEFIKNDELSTQTWIVSDLKSKNEIQKRLIEKQGFFLESSILRASDFWKIALRRLAPQIQIVSQDFIQIVVDHFVEKFGSILEIKSSESSTLNAYIQELAPILLHPESDQLLSEWFAKQAKPKKWNRWHLLSKACIKFITAEHSMVDPRWIAAYLQSLELQHFEWRFDLIVDLGTEMSSVEMGLFKILAQKVKVKIIWPEPIWKEKYPFLLKTYRDHSGYSQVHSPSLFLAGKDSNPPQFKRVSTQLSEIKFAVSQIRKWSDNGIPLEKIAVISAQIEKYWPVLKYFLDEEGLIYQKDHVVRLNSLGLIQNFLAFCNNLMAEVSWDSLEISYFSKHQTSDYSFENFKALFYQFFDESDLFRDSKIKELFYRKIDFSKKIGREEFLMTIVKLWSEALQFHQLPFNDQQIQLFELLFKDFLSRSSDLQTDFKKWFRFLQSCINSQEIKIESSQVKGIQILPLMSAHMTDTSYQIWIGLDEKSLASKKKHLIPLSDIFELKSHFDFSIEYPEESFYDFNMRWLSEKKSQQKVFLCANSSFESEPLTPSLFFLENNSKHEITIPTLTRHDEIQNHLAQIDFSEAHLEKNLEPYDFSKLNIEGIKKDLVLLPNYVLIEKINSITPSEIEEYWNCGFKLLAQKVFRLRDLPQVAVDLDPRQKGSLLHQLFEYLVSEKQEFLIENEVKKNIHHFLDQKRLEFKIYPDDDLLWSIQKNKLTLIGIAFFQFEENRQKVLQSMTEKSFELFFDVETKQFLAPEKRTEFSIQIRGRIDRIDRTEDGLVIYDYKSSTSDLKNHSDWLDHGEFQLLLYLLACEKVLYPDQLFIASVYYDYRKLDFSKGLMTEEFHRKQINNSRKIKGLISSDQKKELYDQFTVLLAGLFKRLVQLEFSAHPVDVEICNRCNWSKLCRAQHLA